MRPIATITVATCEVRCVVDRSTSSAWSSEGGVVTYRSSAAVSSSGHRRRRDVTVTSLGLALLAMTSLQLLAGDVAATVRWSFGVVILSRRWWSVSGLLYRPTRTAALNGDALTL